MRVSQLGSAPDIAFWCHLLASYAWQRPDPACRPPAAVVVHGREIKSRSRPVVLPSHSRTIAKAGNGNRYRSVLICGFTIATARIILFWSQKKKGTVCPRVAIKRDQEETRGRCKVWDDTWSIYAVYPLGFHVSHGIDIVLLLGVVINPKSTG